MQLLVHALQALLLVGLLLPPINAQDHQDATFVAAPINTAAPQSDSFALINTTECDKSVTATIYQLYSRNTMVFQTCVAEGNFRIFPFSGEFPTTQQIGDMGRSLACRAIFLSALLAGIPECNIGGFPLRAAGETELKIAVNMDNYPNASKVIPSTERFVDMMHWRRNVNLAKAAGLPYDSGSQLYSEFAGNLYTVTSNGLIRLTTDQKIEYRSALDGSFSQDEIISMPDMPDLRGSGSNEDFVGNVGERTLPPSFESSASRSNDTITHSGSADRSSSSDTAAANVAGQICWSRIAATVVAFVTVVLTAAS